MLFNDSHLLKGRLNVNKKGFGFLIIDNQDDLYVDSKNMNGALNNDIVVCEPITVNGKTEAKVIKVLKKQNNLIVGEFNIDEDGYTFTPDDEKIKAEIILDEKSINGLVDGNKIQVSIIKNISKYKYLGEVVKVIGHKNDPGVDILSICYEHGITDTFSDETLKELESIPDKVYELTLPSGRKILPPNGRCWLYTKPRFQEMIDDNRIWFGEDGNNVPRVKRFLSEVKQGLTPMSIWKYTEVGHSQDAAQRLKELFGGKDLFD